MRFAEKPLTPFGTIILEMSVPNQLSFKTPLVFRMINELIDRGHLPATGSPRAELVLDEALTNAMVHGNKLDPDRMVLIRVFGEKERWGVIVVDEGDGFTEADVPRADDPDAIFRETGRGIMLMDDYLDELIYGPKGNSVMLVRHSQTRPDDVEAEAFLAAADAEEAPKGAGPVGTMKDGQVTVVEIFDQRVSDDNLHPIREAMMAAADAAPGLVIDMHRAIYISSSVIGALMAVFRHLRGKKGHLCLADVQPSVKDILKSVALDRILQFADDRDQAVAVLKEKIGAGE